jgi:hypothetical protein
LRLIFASCAVMMAAAAAPATAQAPSPGAQAFERFFTGTTAGTGTVQVILAGRHAMKDRGTGRMDGNALVIDQLVEEEGKPPRRRSWRLLRSGPSGVRGTISDARGAVVGDVKGATLHLKYRLSEGPPVEQWITLAPGGRTATNRMTFHRFGMKVASVQSVIRKLD